MKLSVNLIYAALQESVSGAMLRKRNKNDNELLLSYPHYYPSSFTIEQNRVYIAPLEHLPVHCAPNGPCLLITTQMPGKNISMCNNLSIITVGDTDVATLFDLVADIFDRYNQWDSALKELIFQDAPLEAYLADSLSVIGNAMSVHDNSFSYLAQAGITRASGLSGGNKREFFDPDFLLRVDKQSSESIFYAKELIYFRDEGTKLEYYFLNLFSGSTAAGRLVVISTRRSFLPQDGALIRHMARYLETALTCSAFSGCGRNLRRDSLLEYLTGKDHSDDKIIHLKTVSPFSKLQEDQSLYCLICTCRDSSLTEQYISFQLERALPDSVSVLFNARIVLLCTNRPKQTADSLFQEIETLLKKYNVTAGCSNPFTDFYDLKYCYRQAEFALKSKGHMASAPLLSHFKSYTLEHFLQYGCSILPWRLVCADCVLRLAEHDKTASVSYCDSLHIFLDTGLNASETARRLNIKRNTFLARLERIMRFIDLDLDNMDDRLYLLLSLRLIQTPPVEEPHPFSI